MSEGKGYAQFPVSSRQICFAFIALLLLAGVTALILYLVYHSSRPHFNVTAAAVYELSNASSSSAAVPPGNVISASMQFTIVSRNPNHRSSIFYDRLSAYITYRNQPITPPVPLPPMFQEKDSTVAISPVVSGGAVPISPDVAAGLMADQACGVVGLRLVLLGRLRYKAGPFRSGRYGMYVRCDMVVGFKKGVAGQVPLLGQPECKVDA